MTTTTDFTREPDDTPREAGYWIIDADGDSRYNSPYTDAAEATADYFAMLADPSWVSPRERPLRLVHIETQVTAADITPPPAPTMVSIRLDDLDELLSAHKAWRGDGATDRALRQRCHIAASYARKAQS